MGKVLISGATGWLGRETIRKVVSGSFKEIDSSNLILQSSKNRLVDFGNGYKFPVQEFNGRLEEQEIMGFVHLAFLTREKVAEYGFENYAIRNLQLISSACQVIRRMKPKWVVLVSSGAIFDRESGNMEDDLVRNPYGYLKRNEELALTDAAKDANANIVIGRLWGAAGSEMPINRAYAISDFIEQAFYDKKIQINSGGNVFRKYCDAGEFMEVIFLITGEQVYKQLKYESGVHRVQRIPVTEGNGRVHTSTVTVAVLPEAEEVDVQIDPEDLLITVMRASGPGGQGVNTTDSAVRIVHQPSGLTVYCADDRSQIKNKARAMAVLRSRLLKLKEDEEHAKYAAQRRTQIGTGGRSERIRTYSFPQNRLTDHRIGLTIYSLPAILEGAIDSIIEALQRAEFEEKLAALTGGPLPVRSASTSDDD